MATTVNYDAKVEHWKSKLLDLTMRNALLNMAFKKRGTVVRIEQPECDLLWNRLVEREAQIRFARRTRVDAEAELAEYKRLLGDTELVARGMSAPKPPAPFVLKQTPKETEAILPLSGNDQQKRLKAIRTKARSFLEERGVNTLHVTLGAVRWVDQKRVEHLAPLLLVPVTLSIRSKSSPYVLEKSEDDPSVNETFQLKVKQDFGVVIPLLEENELPSQYFARVGGFVARLGWTVEPCAALGIFNFSTISMYHDLVENKDQIIANRNVRAICGAIDSCDVPPHEGAERRGALSDDVSFAVRLDADLSQSEDRDSLGDHMRLHEEGMPHGLAPSAMQMPLKILDSDSSQDRAVAWANAGVSFVLQGPPGTGKSQTIANIIGESLYAGKNVLFVSEKRAALDVVKRRLEGAGLGDWVFVLHDLKSNKKEAVDSLARQLDGMHGVTSTKATANDRSYNKVKAGLDTYAFEVYEKVEPLGISAWDAFGELARLRDAPGAVFAFDGVDSVDQIALDGLREAVDGLALAVREAPEGISSSPWRGIKVMRLTEDAACAIISVARSSHDAGESLTAEQGNAAELLSVSREVVAKAGSAAVSRVLDACVAFAGLGDSLRARQDLDALSRAAQHVREVSRAAAPLIAAFADELKEIRATDPACLPAAPLAIDCEAMASFASVIDGVLAGDGLMAALASRPEAAPRLQKFAERLEAYGESREDILASYTKDVFDLDCRGMLLRAEQGYTSGLKRLFSSEFKEDLMAVSRCARKITSQRMEYEQLKHVLHQLDEVRAQRDIAEEALDAVLQSLPNCHITLDAEPKALAKASCLTGLLCKARVAAVRLEEACRPVRDDLLLIQAVSGIDYRGLQTDLSAIDEAKCLLEGVRTATSEAGLPCQDVLGSTACRTCLPQDLTAVRDRLAASYETYETSRSETLGYFQPNAALASLDPEGFAQTLASCLAHEADLPAAVNYERRVEACEKMGLGEFVAAIEREGYRPDAFLPIFERRFYTLWLEKVCAGLPSVADFVKAEQERRIEEFGQLDQYELHRASDRIVASLRGQLVGRVSDKDARVLRHEAAKVKRVKPLRRLLEEIPGLITALKPCMMMSPLSVSTFLKSRSIEFDLVIFDEGSQVCTENAIGAISRGRQVIIGGDSKQLPPTSFFAVTTAGEEDVDAPVENEVIDEFDSVLDEASMMPSTTLRWHYRSRNESLIDFSNREIYGGSLVTFPSSQECAPGVGVSFTYVPDGVWLGSTEGNRVEARSVAQMIIKHYEDHPKRSLGVITFGTGHMNAIASALSELRAERPAMEQFFDENVEEPFFIKSLEGVQGDERDSIILSVGFARSETGLFAMRFGPLGMSGGERRLNVAVTRAKQDLTVVSSVTEDDFRLTEGSAHGALLLRDYIAYARRCSCANGPDHEPLASKDTPEGGEAVSGIRSETPLVDYLVGIVEQLGLVAIRGVGETKNRVDIGVKASADDGRYIAGIVTDGPSYHAARSTRERERIRPNMLNAMGWRLYDVWAPAWGRNPEGEAEGLRAFLQEVAQDYKQRVRSRAKETMSPEVDVAASSMAPSASEVGLPERLPAVEEGSSVEASGSEPPVAVGSPAAEDAVTSPGAVEVQQTMAKDDSSQSADKGQGTARLNNRLIERQLEMIREDEKHQRDFQRTAAAIRAFERVVRNGSLSAEEKRAVRSESGKRATETGVRARGAVEDRRATVREVTTKGAVSFAPYVRTRNIDRYMNLRECMRAVVDQEAPISLNLLCKDALEFLGAESVTPEIRRRVRTLFERDATGNYELLNDYVYKKGQSAAEFTPRKRGRRAFGDIAPAELEMGILLILRQAFGAKGARMEELYSAVMAAFGFSKVTDLARLKLAAAVSSLKRSGKAASSRGRLFAS